LTQNDGAIDVQRQRSGNCLFNGLTHESAREWHRDDLHCSTDRGTSRKQRPFSACLMNAIPLVVMLCSVQQCVSWPPAANIRILPPGRYRDHEQMMRSIPLRPHMKPMCLPRRIINYVLPCPQLEWGSRNLESESAATLGGQAWVGCFAATGAYQAPQRRGFSSCCI
jgi:hypothetical protein